jgi:hypothetical protein
VASSLAQPSIVSGFWPLVYCLAVPPSIENQAFYYTHSNIVKLGTTLIHARNKASEPISVVLSKYLTLKCVE